MMQISGISGKHILITGAAGLLGSKITKNLATNGALITIVDINEKGAKDLASTLTLDGHKVFLAAGTLANSLNSAAEINALLDQAEQRLGPIDILVHAAYPRTSDWHLKLEEIPEDSWRHNVDAHLNGTFLICQQLGKRMAARSKGNIILFSSIYGLGGPDFNIYKDLSEMTMPAAYAAIKGGITNFTRYLASYWGKKGVRVNAICPGGVFNSQPESFIKYYNERVPLGRMATEDDICGPVAFLCSDMSSYLTGVNLPVDGGWTAI